MRTIPNELWEAGLALGARQSRVVRSVIVRGAIPGLVTANLLALARAVGETAPLLFTTIGSQIFSLSLNQPMNAIPIVIYQDGNHSLQAPPTGRLGRRLRPHGRRAHPQHHRPDLRRPLDQEISIMCISPAQRRRKCLTRRRPSPPGSSKRFWRRVPGRWGCSNGPAAVTLTDVAGRLRHPCTPCDGSASRWPPTGSPPSVGPSGCGKTTVLRAINRMHDRSGGKVSGSIRLGDMEIYGRERPARAHPQPHRHGLPAPQPLPHHEHHRQRHLRPALQRHPQQEGPARRRRSRPCSRPPCGTRSRTASTSRRCASRVASSSVCASHGPWPSSPRCC